MRLGGLLQQLAGSGKSDRLIMRGPGGRGALDVAVSSVPGTVISSFIYLCLFDSILLGIALKHVGIARNTKSMYYRCQGNRIEFLSLSPLCYKPFCRRPL